MQSGAVGAAAAAAPESSQFPESVKRRPAPPAPAAGVKPEPKGEKPKVAAAKLTRLSQRVFSLVLKYLKKCIYCRVFHRSTKSLPSEQPSRRGERPGRARAPQAERGSPCPGHGQPVLPARGSFVAM